MEIPEFYAPGNGNDVAKKIAVLYCREDRAREFIYGGEEDSIRQQVLSFKKDFDEQPRGSINAMLTYGFFDCVYDGEEA